MNFSVLDQIAASLANMGLTIAGSLAGSSIISGLIYILLAAAVALALVDWLTEGGHAALTGLVRTTLFAAVIFGVTSTGYWMSIVKTAHATIAQLSSAVAGSPPDQIVFSILQNAANELSAAGGMLTTPSTVQAPPAAQGAAQGGFWANVGNSVGDALAVAGDRIVAALLGVGLMLLVGIKAAVAVAGVVCQTIALDLGMAVIPFTLALSIFPPFRDLWKKAAEFVFGQALTVTLVCAAAALSSNMSAKVVQIVASVPANQTPLIAAFIMMIVLTGISIWLIAMAGSISHQLIGGLTSAPLSAGGVASAAKSGSNRIANAGATAGGAVAKGVGWAKGKFGG